MKHLLTSILLLLAHGAMAWDSTVLVGEWERYTEGHDRRYERLVINADLSGSYSVVIDDADPKVLMFKPDNWQVHDGYADLRVNEVFRMLLSAWRREQGQDQSGRLLGQAFYYHKEREEQDLFLINAIPLHFTPVNVKGFAEFSEKVNRINAQER